MKKRKWHESSYEDAPTMCQFEVGKSYGNGNTALSRKVIARTMCYVTFEGGMRKKIHYSTRYGDLTEFVPSVLPEFCVFASCVTAYK